MSNKEKVRAGREWSVQVTGTGLGQTAKRIVRKQKVSELGNIIFNTSLQFTGSGRK